MTTENLITLSVVSHGNAEQISRLLASLQQQEQATTRFQLILTDNLKNDLPNFDPSPWASLHILRNDQQMGFAQNHNNAFKVSQGSYFAILNPDLIFERPVFEQLRTSLHKHHADVIAPKIVDEHGNTQDSFRTMPSPFEIIRR